MTLTHMAAHVIELFRRQDRPEPLPPEPDPPGWRWLAFDSSHLSWGPVETYLGVFWDTVVFLRDSGFMYQVPATDTWLLDPELMKDLERIRLSHAKTGTRRADD